ncbi:hypothetical protein [Actinotalea solisilvae]|uniref:hypothetical protein n=1 Tax=Actinotalea solisilvae TaxID=2072922 RepID=UPI0018F160E8|nr:hypothetical protein [Actinotalea solisilvae]
MIPIVVFVIAMGIAAWRFSRSQGAAPQQWVRDQGLAVGAILVSGVVGVALQPGPVRFVWLALALAAAVRLAILPRQHRARVAAARP